MTSLTPTSFALVLAAKAIRMFAFGLLSVALALYLAERGLSPLAVGGALTVALLAGAVTTAVSGVLVDRLGMRYSLVLSATIMTIAGLLLGFGSSAVSAFLACSLGVVSAGGQEVGPFVAIEQLIAVETSGGAPARRLATYNVCGAIALAVGALGAAVIPLSWIPWSYSACGLILLAIYARLPDMTLKFSPARSRSEGSRTSQRLAALFGLDALAGGFVVQSFLAYWLHVRFGVDQRPLGLLFFAANTLAAISYPVAAWLSEKIGLLRTMVFTHLPSNVLLCIVPLMPTFRGAAALLLARFALSQMDVPMRQAFTMHAVAPEERMHAAALTNAVRPASAAVAPILSGLAVQTAALGLPFFLAGGLKIVYDLLIFAAFRRVPTTQFQTSSSDT